MAIVVADVLAVWMIRKLCDVALKKTTDLLFGNKEKRALRKAVSIAIDKFKGEHPVAFGGLFTNKLFWDALEEEFSCLLSPNSQPNIEELANKVESVSPVKKKELQKCLNRLFEILREEIVKQPDLIAIEQFRILFALSDELRAPSIDTIDTKARIASKKDLEQFIPVLGIPSIIIELGSYMSSDKEREISNKDVTEFLESGYNIILEAEPGAGKSNTLYQIAKSMQDKDEAVFPVFLSLPNWPDNKDFLEFIAQTDAFSEQRLSLGNIRSLARHGHLAFFIDGWNELSGEKLKKARVNISNLQKEYPNSGILIATRSVSLPPKLNMSLNVTLNRLDRHKRNEIIRNAIDDKKADELIARIDDRTALRQIAQTPFYLVKMLSVYQGDGFLPETKEALLSTCAHINDDKEELVEELNGCHHDYMAALSVEMFGVGTTILGNDSACKVIASVSQELKSDGKFNSPPDPPKILEALAKYHLLINRNGGKSWQFQHQQFQEWYASRWVEKLIVSVSDGSVDSLKELREEVLNIPRWEEALFFAIERLAEQEGQQDKLVMIVINALEIDPILSAEIIALSDEAVWSQVKDTVLDYVERWHKPEKIDRALSFMMASGRPEFSDKLWPLITHENQQERLPALRAYKPFRFNCLGEGWQKKLEGYSEDIRDDVLSQIADYGGIEGLDVVTEIATQDTSAKVQIGVLEVAYFRNSPAHVQRILETASPDVWKVYCRLFDPEEMDDTTKSQAIKITQEELNASDNKIDRLRLCLRLWEFGVNSIKDALFEALADLEDEKDDRWNVFWLIEKLIKIDPEKTTFVLINRFVQGGKLDYNHEEFLIHSTKEDRQRLAYYVAEGNGDFSGQATAAKAFQKSEATLLLKKLLELSDEAALLPRLDVPKELRDRISNIERTLKNIPEHYLVEAIVPLNGSKWERAFLKAKHVSSTLLGFIGKKKNNSVNLEGTTLKLNHISELAGLLAWPENRRGDQPDSHRLELSDKLETSFRVILKNWSFALRNHPHESGRSLAEICAVLGRIGNEEDASLISEILEFDFQYRKNLLQEWERNKQRGQRPQQSSPYTNLYRGAFEATPHRKAVEVVTSYLKNPEFCKEAAVIIRHSWFVENGLLSRDTNWSPHPDYSKVLENMQKLENQERPNPHPYVENVLNRIEELLPQQEDPKVRGMIFSLANVIGDTEYGNRVNVLETVIGLEGLGKYVCLMKLIQKGEKISAVIIKPCCETIRKEWEEQHWKKTDDWYRVAQWLELLALSDDPMQVMDLVKDLPEHMQQERTFDRILNGLRYSPSEDAEKTLLALAEAFPDLEKNGDWLKAMHDQLTETSYRFFYEILWDPNKAQHYTNHTRWSRDPFVNIIEKIIRGNPKLKQDFIEKLETPLAHHLGAIIGLIVQRFDDDDEITQASLMLLRNGGLMPYGIEDYVTHRKPVDENNNMFNIVPSSAVEIRKRLLDMSVNDPERNEAASRVLAAIDELRNEHGRPEDEPRHPDLDSGIPWPLVIQSE
jgi:hypothetical protein